MTWVKLDDGFWRHPKVRRALDKPDGLAAVGLWALAQSWIGEEMTDGFVPSRQPVRLLGVDASEAAAILVEIGLWEVTEGGWHVHDYLDYNWSKKRILADRAQRHRLAVKGGLARVKSKDVTGRFSSRAAGPMAGQTAGGPAGRLAGETTRLTTPTTSRAAGNGAGPHGPALAPATGPAPSPVSRSPFSASEGQQDVAVGAARDEAAPRGPLVGGRP